MSDQIRQFEAWFLEKRPKCNLDRMSKFSEGSDDEYCSQRVQDRWEAWQESQKQSALKQQWTEIDYNNSETFPRLGKRCLVAWNKNNRGEPETFDEVVTFNDDHPAFWMDTYGHNSYDLSDDDMPLPTHWKYLSEFGRAE